MNTYTTHTFNSAFMSNLPLYYIGFRFNGAGVIDEGRGNHSGQVASDSSSWAEGVEPRPVSS